MVSSGCQLNFTNERKSKVASARSPCGIFLYVAGHSHLTVKSYAHFWSPQITGDIVHLPNVQSKSIQIIKGLENSAYGQRWKELETSSIPRGQGFPTFPLPHPGNSECATLGEMSPQKKPISWSKEETEMTMKVFRYVMDVTVEMGSSCACLHPVWSKIRRQKPGKAAWLTLWPTCFSLWELS